MNASWLQSQTVRRVAGLMTDPRPAWLWAAGERETLIWRNRASEAFIGKLRRKRWDEFVPVSRQVARNIRLGTLDLASLSRMQFSLGSKPISATCTCTPVLLETGETGLLVVLADPVGAGALAAAEIPALQFLPLLGANQSYVLRDAEGQVIAGSEDGRHRALDAHEPSAVLSAGPHGAQLLVYAEFATRVEDAENQDVTVDIPSVDEAPQFVGPDNAAEWLEPDGDGNASDSTPTGDRDVEPPIELPREGLVTVIGMETAEELRELREFAASDHDAVPKPNDTSLPDPDSDGLPRDLTLLLDKLAGSGNLFAPLDQTDENSITDTPDPVEPDDAATPESQRSAGQIWRLVGERFTPDLSTESEYPATGDEDDDQRNDPVPTGNSPDEAAEPVQDKESVDRISRYNFDELSRILGDRVSNDSEADETKTPRSSRTHRSGGSLVTLGDENLILNRLPLGLLVFRDQNLLFANRALTELLGYADTASLRDAGLAAVFPGAGDGADEAGPVTQLRMADGSMLNVTARLQTISWQGRSALLLSARRQEKAASADSSVRRFAEALAEAQGQGYFETSRAGIISSVSGRAAALFGRSPDILIGRPVHGLIALNEGARLRSFLERPARFAGGERPSHTFDGSDPAFEVLMFAEGMAGIVTSYFGFLRRLPEAEGSKRSDNELDPAILARVSRSIRQPVNSIVGFSELIRSQAFGPIESPRYVEYARHIRSAGHDIAGLIDELEEFAQLRSTDFSVQRAEVDLAFLLERSVKRVRAHASNARVLVRSGISAGLPPINADAETLSQAVLNLLASAIEQTPEGGQVVLSAQVRADGSIEVHVRDSGNAFGSELDERFVVFRDGVSADGEARKPVRSSVGLALTRSLVAVNACLLNVDPSPGAGTLMSLVIPAELVSSPPPTFF